MGNQGSQLPTVFNAGSLDKTQSHKKVSKRRNQGGKEVQGALDECKRQAAGKGPGTERPPSGSDKWKDDGLSDSSLAGSLMCF